MKLGIWLWLGWVARIGERAAVHSSECCYFFRPIKLAHMLCILCCGKVTVRPEINITCPHYVL